jgi:hypothetical protein
LQAFHQHEFDRTFFFHFRKEVEPFAAITVAVGLTGPSLFAASALCSPADGFCRKVGRTIALGRAKQIAFRHLADYALKPPSIEKIREVANELAAASLESKSPEVRYFAGYPEVRYFAG